jgi:repressor LexA
VQPRPRITSGPRQSVGDLVALRRRVRGWTLQQLADEVECARSYLWMIERGTRSSPSEKVLARIERALGFADGELLAAARWEAVPAELRTQVDQLRGAHRAAARLAEIVRDSRAGALDRAHQSGELEALVNTLDSAQTRRTSRTTRKPPATPIDVPLINSVAAGYPREFTDLGYPAGIADDYVRVPGMTDRDAFACRVVGDSMLPEYREGDIVVFSPQRPIVSGLDCLARLEPDSQTTFKRVYLERQDGREVIRLQPLNSKYAASTLDRESVAGLFAAVSVTRMVTVTKT